MIQCQVKLKFYFGRIASQRKKKTKNQTGPSLAALWLKLCDSTTGGKGSVPREGNKILHASQPKEKKERKKERKKEKHSNTNTNQ